ncbi:MAG: LON peptidase substrate-binding domain-containing protein, partial [Thiothrix litoralis]
MNEPLILIPMRDIVLFPGMAIPITVGREQSLAAAQEAVKNGSKIGLVLQKQPDINEPASDHLHPIGTLANIVR